MVIRAFIKGIICLAYVLFIILGARDLVDDICRLRNNNVIYT